MIFSWLASLGLASKLAIGASAVTVGVVGGGAAGVLPPVAQETFDQVVALDEEPAVEVPVEEVPVEEAPAEEVPAEEVPAEEAPVEEAPEQELVEDGGDGDELTHGDKVSAVAQDKTLQGRAHGQAVSAAARDKGDKQAKLDDDGEGEGDADDEEKLGEDETAVDVEPAKQDAPKSNGKGNSKGRS